MALVVEVADTSLAKDRGEKLLAYARGGVPVYWIVNLMGDQVEVYSEPDRNMARYTNCVVYAASETVPLRDRRCRTWRGRRGGCLAEVQARLA